MPLGIDGQIQLMAALVVDGPIASWLMALAIAIFVVPLL
jgi:hypothetical protein